MGVTPDAGELVEEAGDEVGFIPESAGNVRK